MQISIIQPKLKLHYIKVKELHCGTSLEVYSNQGFCKESGCFATFLVLNKLCPTALSLVNYQALKVGIE